MLATSPTTSRRPRNSGGASRASRPAVARLPNSCARGDRLIYYVTRHVAFAALAEVRGGYFEDHDPVWTSKPGEAWRVEIAPEVVVDQGATTPLVGARSLRIGTEKQALN